MSEEYKTMLLNRVTRFFIFWFHSKRRSYLVHASRPLFDCFFEQLRENIESGKISHDERGLEELREQFTWFYMNVFTKIKK
jgi:hypothetical protein